MSEINMTPLIDVMLVLLVIFIVTAPLMATRLRLDLPQAEAGRPDSSMAVLEVALDAEGRLFIGQSPANLAELAARAREAAQRNPATEVQLRADRGVAYGRVAEIIGVVQAAGLNRVGFVTEAPPNPK